MSEKKPDLLKRLDIVFDGPPGPECGRFVEAERDGAGVCAGDWIELGDGLWALRLYPDPAVAELALLRKAVGRIKHRPWLRHTAECRFPCTCGYSELRNVIDRLIEAGHRLTPAERLEQVEAECVRYCREVGETAILIDLRHAISRLDQSALEKGRYIVEHTGNCTKQLCLDNPDCCNVGPCDCDQPELQAALDKAHEADAMTTPTTETEHTNDQGTQT